MAQPALLQGRHRGELGSGEGMANEAAEVRRGRRRGTRTLGSVFRRRPELSWNLFPAPGHFPIPNHSIQRLSRLPM